MRKNWKSNAMKVGAILLAASLFVEVSSAQDVAYPDAEEVISLATNVDRAIQACGRQTAARSRGKADFLHDLGLVPAQEVPETIAGLASPSTFAASKFYRWSDPHAVIWLIASDARPACRIAVSESKWIGEIDRKLNELILVGNVWRPAKDGDTPFAQPAEGSGQKIYVMDLPPSIPLRPVMLISNSRPGKAMPAAQQMIISLITIESK